MAHEVGWGGDQTFGIHFQLGHGFKSSFETKPISRL
jgi:hypothetical protein